MITIGKVYLNKQDGQARLCADISLSGKTQTLWFGVDADHGEYLCPERSDAFIMALLPVAMTDGEDIAFETPMSQRLHYQLENYLIPILSMEGDRYREISLRGPMAEESIKNMGAVGLGGFRGEHARGALAVHGAGSEYPVTHLVLPMEKTCGEILEMPGITTVEVSSNLSEILGEEDTAVCSYRRIAEAMALQGLLSMYLLPADRGIDAFSFAAENSGGYDFLTVHCAQTESLRVYLPGIQG